MKVLLTGASGFVGSHILDTLIQKRIATTVLLRGSSSREFLPRSHDFEARIGSFSDSLSLREALRDITHVIHCAGCVRARDSKDFFEGNEGATRNLLQAIASVPGQVQRFLLVSSLAAAGPGLPSNPASEEKPPAPVSVYGRSKLAGEEAVRNQCPCDYVILRPPAVYGPRDREFLRLFRAAGNHIHPRPGPQPLSLVFVKDLAEAAVHCLAHPGHGHWTYFVAHPEIVTSRQIANEIAARMGGWGVPLPLPGFAFWPLCLLSEALARLSGRPSVLSLEKYTELTAPGWVCTPAKLKRTANFECMTDLRKGISLTLNWYRKEGWVKK